MSAIPGLTGTGLGRDTRATSASVDDERVPAIRLTRLQRVMIGNGILILFMGMVAGLGLWTFLVGGFELIPGSIIHFSVPGSADGWAKAHRGTPMNAFMVFTVAMFLPSLGFKARNEALLGWSIICAGWGNTGFYFFSNFSENRGLTFGSNPFGPGGVWSFLALAPAYVFALCSMLGLIYMARRAFQRD